MSCCSACGAHACACGCGAAAGTPLPICNRPGLDRLAYRVGTYADFHASMQAGLGDAGVPALAGLRTREADDPAMALLDAWAVGAEVISFYNERIANEGYLRTATERRSVLELARLVDYRPRPGVAASVYVAYTVEKDSPPVTLAAGSRAQSVPAPGEQMQTFETADALDARYEWNALQARQTRPQLITRGGLGVLTQVAFNGAANNLKTNDWLVFEFDDGNAPEVRQIGDVAVDNVLQRTMVTLQSAVQTSAPGSLASSAKSMSLAASASIRGRSDPFEKLVDALAQPPALQPANAQRLSRSVGSALGNASDVRPQLLLNVEPRLIDTFYRAWSSRTSAASSAQVTAVYVQRMAAARFGYNAPWPTKLVKDASDVYQTQPAADWISRESDNTLFLDNANDAIQPGSYAIVCTPAAGDVEASTVVRKITAVAVHPRSAYGLSGKTTELTLEPSANNGMVAMINLTHPISETVRVQQVFVQSEALPLGELPIAGAVGATTDASSSRSDSATRLTLATAVDGLKAGRWVIVEGQRSDVPGTTAVSAAELVMLAAVEQGVDATLPGDTVHSTLVFANQGLAYRYRRDSVTIRANVVRATHGETRNEVLGSGNAAAAMQVFALKQSPLTRVSAATVDGVQSTLSVQVNDMLWHETRNLAFVGADDRNFVTITDDDDKTRVIFGDGTHGARLPTGVENIVAKYRNGIGTPGNVGAGRISLLASKPLGIKEVINPLRASGGADRESGDQARRNVPLAVLALDRLVSVPDYGDFARTFGGVGKALATRVGNLVQVTIAGAADAPIAHDADLYRNLLQALQNHGDPALLVRLDVRELLALTLSAKVGLATDYVWESIEPLLRAALLDAFGFERRALAQNVYLSEIVACMLTVEGVAWVGVDALGSLDEAALLAGFSNDDDDGKDDGKGSVPGSFASASDEVPARVQVLPARLDASGALLPAQLAYLPPNVPDTLLLQEALS